MPIGYGIFSGGLDSMLAALVLMDQGLEVRLLTFVTPFFNADRALDSGRILGITPRPLDITAEHLEMLKQPKHGFGRYMNPCIDCHALMFRKAGEIMEAEGGDFLFSGEVLGQRPMSQNRKALDVVARESGRPEVVLRPLSALSLKPTRVEIEGLVDRSRLLGLSGRTRKPQMALAALAGISEYPSPAGGCLLTEPVFSRRLKELWEREQLWRERDVHLLKHGRHFRLPGGSKLIVGRNQKDNELLAGLTRDQDTTLRVPGLPGPYVLAPGGNLTDTELSADMTVSYSDARDGEEHQVCLASAGSEEYVITGRSRPKDEFNHLLI